MIKKVNKDTLIDNAIKENPALAEDFFKMGMMCIGCPMSASETIEQGCQAHGMTDKQISKFVDLLNKKLEKKAKKKKSIKKMILKRKSKK